jgi:hypothetical protein
MRTKKQFEKLGVSPEKARVVREELSPVVYDGEAKTWRLTRTEQIEFDTFDAAVEVEASVLKQPVPAELLPEVAETKVTWGEHCWHRRSLDGSKALVKLAPRVGRDGYDARLLTAETLRRYADHFGTENLLTTEEYAGRIRSNDYRENLEEPHGPAAKNPA